MSKSSGRSKPRGSRVAAPVSRSTGKPAGIVPPSNVAVLDGEPPLVLRRRVVAEDLLDRLRDAARGRPGPHRHWSGWASNSTTALPTSLVTVSAPAPPSSAAKPAISWSDEAGLGAVAAVDGHLGEAGEHVVGRVGPLLGGQVQEVPDHLEHRGLSLRRRVDLAGLAVQRQVEPLADLLALALGHAEHPGDDLDGERRGEVGHGVEGVAVRRAGRAVGDDLADHRLERRDRPRA